MNKKLILSALTAATMAASWSANATLEPRLNGQAYYDTETDLTWTTDANINSKNPWHEQMEWVSSLVIDNVGGWRVPHGGEYASLLKFFSCENNYYICFALPEEPFDNVQWQYWTSDLIPDDEERFIANFFYQDYPLVNYLSLYPIWPVHTGDVARISAVPEPATYAMLLAGLGLVGFMGRHKNE